MSQLLHERLDFHDLLRLVAEERGIDPVLVEKDYWIMHCLWGLQQQGFHFELKGGTSLSKGFGVIQRFSEDIDLRIEPALGQYVKMGRNQNKPAHVESRRNFYDDLSRVINIPGIEQVVRDTDFDDLTHLRSAGIRLNYVARTGSLAGVKDGILLELGFDDTAPNRPVTISSWALEKAMSVGVHVTDNRARDVLCYAPTHTFVEKLQTISTKYRTLPAGGAMPRNFMRHYYDVYCLLAMTEVQDFLGTAAYEQRKQQRFRQEDELVIARNPAFLLTDLAQREAFRVAYQASSALYYQGQPDFDQILRCIHESLPLM
ncbi:MAG: nucleotidyl transferase AbiEii/AbiGii toxin family protein [Pseudomonadota bacterium]